jgi:hypothetical protein
MSFLCLLPRLISAKSISNQIISERTVARDKTEYRFNLKKRDNKTRIFGTGYTKFFSDFDMDVGDRVSIDLDHFEGFFGIIPECPISFEKHRVQGN